MRTYRSGIRHRRSALIAATTGTVLVVATIAFVLTPVTGLMGTAASAGPLLHLPLASITAAVTVGILAAAGLLVAAFATRHAWLAWTTAILAWLISLAASLWPLIAAAMTAVDRAGDVIPWIVELVQMIL